MPGPVLATGSVPLLNRLDLRGTGTDELARRLPRPSAQVEPPIDEVRALLADVRGAGRRRPARAAPSASTASRVDDLRVPDGRAGGRARAPSPPTLRAALEVGRRQHHRLPRDPARTPTPTHRNGGIIVRELHRPGRPGRPATCPAAWRRYASTVLMTAVPARVAGVPEVVLCVAARPDGTRRRRASWPRPPLAGVDEVYRVGGAQADRRPGLRHRVDPAGRRDRRARATPTSRRPSARSPSAGLVGVPSALRRPVRGRGGRRRLDARRLRRHRRRRCRPSTAPTAWPGWSPGTRPWPTPSPPRSAEIVPRSPRRAEHRGHARRGRLRRARATAPEQAIAVANAIAPEHLELLRRRPRGAAAARAPRRRRVLRAVRAGLGRRLPRRPQPRAAHLRLGPLLRGAARSTTSSSTSTSCPSTQTALRRGRRRTSIALADARGPRRPRRVDPPARRAARDDVAPARRPRAHGGLPLAAGRRGRPPQHQRGARAAARRRSRDALAAELADARLAPLPRPRRHRRCGTAIAAHHGVDPAQVFAANGSNEVLQTLCLAYGGPGRTVAVFEPTYALHSHIARITGTGGGRSASATDDFALDLDEVRRVLGRGRARPSRSCARPTTPPAWSSDRGDRARGARPGARAGRGRRGLRAVRPVVGARAGRRRRARSSSPAPTRRRGRWPRPASATSSGRAWLVAAARQGRAAVPPRRGEAGRRPARPRASTTRCEARVAGAGRGAGPAGRRASPSCRSTCGRRAPTSCCSGPRDRDGARGVAGACSTGRCSCATARRGLASTAACGSRSAPPPRTTPSSPPWRRSWHDAAPAAKRAHHQGDERSRVAHRPRRPHGRGRGVAPACRSSTTCSTSSAATAASTSTCRPRATSHVDGHHTVEDVGITARRGVPRGAGRQGRHPPLRQRAVPARRGARRGGPRPVGPPVHRRTTCPSARCCRSATRRSTRRWPSTSGSRFATAAGITLHVTCKAGPQHPPHRRGHLQGRGPLPARRGAGRGRRRPVHQGHAVRAVRPGSPEITASGWTAADAGQGRSRCAARCRRESSDR